jgi:hypothetical protein
MTMPDLRLMKGVRFDSVAIARASFLFLKEQINGIIIY